ncbi:MAG TPA: hypothetical protein ENJ52_03405 [Aliiroseovarius sp.]|nr:hypothetical protein [Aliiroseovarius sp.]
MSYSEPGPNRRLFLVGLLGLGACGFTPIYGPGGAAQGLRGQIEVAAPDDRNGYELVKRLEERLGQPTGARYALSYELDTREEASGYTSDADTSRSQVFGTLRFTLTDSATGQVVQSGSVTSFVSYSRQGTTVATAAAKTDAYRRLMVALADLVTTRLIAGAADWPE